MKSILTGAALALAAAAAAPAQDLAAGVTGSTTLQGWENPVTLLDEAAVQAVVLAVAEEPRTREDAAAMLEGRPYGVDHLVDAWLLDERDGRLYINFNLVTAGDQIILREIREKHGRILAEAFIERWDRISAALDSYDLDTVPDELLAYILVGCFSLDWDGLTVTREQGWRRIARERANGDAFAVWAEARPEPDVLRGLFWGSHNDYVGDVSITTFGDHYATPRNGFPDLAWRASIEISSLDEEVEEAIYNGPTVAGIYGMLDWIGSAMMQLRDGPKTSEEIAEAMGITAPRLEPVLSMLESLEYVERAGDRWSAVIPVLGERDTEVTREILLTGREIMLAWGEANIDEVFADMEQLVAVRQGVEPELMMTKVWHHIFAGANAVLIEEGYLADPYERPEHLGGHFPVVFYSANRPSALMPAAGG